MEHEDLLDASEEVLASDTPQEESAASLTQKIIKKFTISSGNRVSETVNNTQSRYCDTIEAQQVHSHMSVKHLAQFTSNH